MARPRSLLGNFRKLVAEAAHPIWMLDADRRVVYLNEATTQWLGIREEAAVGQRCDFSWAADEESEARLAALAPPPEVFEASGVIPARVVTPRGANLSRRAVTFVPLRDRAGVLTAVWSIAGPHDVENLSALPADDEPERLHHDLALLRAKLGSLYELDQLVGASPAIQRIREQIQLATQAKVRTSIQGPAGSGREQVARTIYYHQSPHGAGVLVPLSCSLLDSELLQSTVAALIHAQPEFEVEGPVCFLLLDADQLSADAQTGLMGVLNIVELQAHTLTTTARSLLQLAEQGTFRADLAHYLSTLQIQLPPLAERREDIPLIAQKMLEQRNAAGGKQWSGFRSEALDQLMAYGWPGNLDELRAIVDAACERAAGTRIEPADLPDVVHLAAQALAHPRRAPETIKLDPYLERVEAELIRRALRRAKNNRARAARLLGISRPRLLRRIEQLKLG